MGSVHSQRQNTQTNRRYEPNFRKRRFQVSIDGFPDSVEGIKITNGAIICTEVPAVSVSGCEFPGYIIAHKPNQSALKNGASRDMIVRDIYAYARMMWYIVRGERHEKMRMDQCAIEARAIAHFLLEKGYQERPEHERVMHALTLLEDQFTVRDFRNERKIQAGDLFMQVAVDPRTEAQKKATQAMTVFAGVRRVEQRAHESFMIHYYMHPRFLQVRALLRRLEQRTHEMSAYFSRSRLPLLLNGVRDQQSQAVYRAIEQLDELWSLSGLLMVVMPFAPQAAYFRREVISLRERLSRGERFSEEVLTTSYREMRFRMSLIRLIMRVERDVIMPLSVLEKREPNPEELVQRKNIFRIAQSDLRKLYEAIERESSDLFEPLFHQESWLERLRLCTKNTFEDHELLRTDCKRFVRYLTYFEPKLAR